MTTTKKITLTLTGLDGNAFALLGAFRRQARKEGWTDIEIAEVNDEATSGDYARLVTTLDAHCRTQAEIDDEGETEDEPGEGDDDAEEDRAEEDQADSLRARQQQADDDHE